MTTHDELLDSVAAYALGVLRPGEAAQVAEHLETCERCREEYRFMRPAVTAVAYSAEASADASGGVGAVSPLLKARVMQRVRLEAAKPPARSAWAAYLVAAACLAIALLSGLAYLSLDSRYARQQQTIADLAAPDARRYAFGTGEVLTRDGRLYIAMSSLAEPPPGHVYQAWTLPRGATAMAPSSTFSPVRGGATVIRLPEAADGVAAVAVSVEPAGGSKQPTTKPIALVRM
jgi:anti-sigma-K factor RskA